MKPAAAPNSASRIKVRKPAIWWVLFLLALALFALDTDQSAKEDCGGEVECDRQKLWICHGHLAPKIVKLGQQTLRLMSRNGVGLELYTRFRVQRRTRRNGPVFVHSSGRQDLSVRATLGLI